MSRYLVTIHHQQLIMPANYEPATEFVRLGQIRHDAIEIPTFRPGQLLSFDPTEDLCHYVGPTEDGTKAVVQWPAGNPRYTGEEWSQLSPADNIRFAARQ